MTAEELGGGVHHDVGAVLQGSDDVGRAEGVVHDEGQAVTVGYGGDAFDVEHVAVGVAEGLGEDGLRLGPDGGFEGLEVVHVDDGVAHTLTRERVGDEVVAAAVEVVGSHEVVSGLQDVLQRIGDGSGAAGNGQTGHTAFEGGHAVFEDALRGVGQTAVDVAGVTQSEAVGGVLRVAEHVAGGLIDGHRTGVGGQIVIGLPHMELKSLESVVVLCAHSLSPFFNDLVFVVFRVQRYGNWRFSPNFLLNSEFITNFAAVTENISSSRGKNAPPAE